jgi:hypothetical protein
MTQSDLIFGGCVTYEHREWGLKRSASVFRKSRLSQPSVMICRFGSVDLGNLAPFHECEEESL